MQKKKGCQKFNRLNFPGKNVVFFSCDLCKSGYITTSLCHSCGHKRVKKCKGHDTKTNLCERGFLPGSVGGLQAPTNWILSMVTQA